MLVKIELGRDWLSLFSLFRSVLICSLFSTDKGDDFLPFRLFLWTIETPFTYTDDLLHLLPRAGPERGSQDLHRSVKQPTHLAPSSCLGDNSVLYGILQSRKKI